MAFEMKEEVKGTTLYVQPTGLMDYSTVEGFEFTVPEGVSNVVVDFAGLDFIDSTGIGAILSIVHTSAEQGVTLLFANLNETVNDLFATVGVFEIMAALQRGGGLSG